MIINSIELTEGQKVEGLKDIDMAIKDISTGTISDFRMKINGVHALPFGGQPGGRMTQINNNGYSIIKMYDRKMNKDFILTNVETIKGNKHIAIYPKELVDKLLDLIIVNSSTVVLDPFMGAGTTALCCLDRGVSYLGYEVNSDYVDKIANPRLDKLVK